MNHLNSMRKFGLIIPANAQAYWCEFCDGGWHLGHGKKEKK